MNYYGQGRSNYFLVKDREAFDKWFEQYADQFRLEERELEQGDAICLLSANEGGDLPSHDEEGDAIEFSDLIAEHLAPIEGNYFIWTHSGSEGMRYVGGWAEATDHEGNHTFVSTGQIYKLAEDKLGHPPISLAEY